MTGAPRTGTQRHLQPRQSATPPLLASAPRPATTLRLCLPPRRQPSLVPFQPPRPGWADASPPPPSHPNPTGRPPQMGPLAEWRMAQETKLSAKAQAAAEALATARAEAAAEIERFYAERKIKSEKRAVVNREAEVAYIQERDATMANGARSAMRRGAKLSECGRTFRYAWPMYMWIGERRCVSERGVAAFGAREAARRGVAGGCRRSIRLSVGAPGPTRQPAFLLVRCAFVGGRVQAGCLVHSGNDAMCGSEC
eukprot:scaffold5732_cov116-Isochrysis_galbana.AAC.3